ncbi:hypothetical protein [Poriferisphaera sp. WC338]|uniref:hypothetical protein n=1 Tax=Poriferisphaera sp. WC338 TaxID=3425129 RepID=UPI003D81C01B
MRLLIDTLIAVMLAMILVGVLFYHRGKSESGAQLEQVREALVRLRVAAVYHGGLKEAPLSRAGYVITVSPSWFEEGMPRNELLSADHPWIDVAPEGDMSDQPPDPVCVKKSQAGFWYNPNRGIFRARVPAGVTSEVTLVMYNRVNDCALPTLPAYIDEARGPVALKALPEAEAYASIDDEVDSVAADREGLHWEDAANALNHELSGNDVENVKRAGEKQEAAVERRTLADIQAE